jgi:hypothetical protein
MWDMIQDSLEHKAIREIVAGIASRFGARYIAQSSLGLPRSY